MYMYVYVEIFIIFLVFFNCEIDFKDFFCYFVVGGVCVWWFYEGYSVWFLCL